jgi:hypothetical protein
MSLSYLTPYNDMLQKTIHEMKPSPADVANYPEILPMMGGRKLRDGAVPESLAYANPLGMVLEAERELRSIPTSNPLHGGEMSGGNIFEDVGKSVKRTATSAAKSAKRTATSAAKSASKSVGKAVSATKKDIDAVKRVAEKIAKSKEGKMIAKVGTKVGTKAGKLAIDSVKESARLGLDIAAKAAPALGGLAGAALAVASLNPELAPVAGAMGAAAASELAKRGRSGIKKTTGLGLVNKAELKKLKKQAESLMDKDELKKMKKEATKLMDKDELKKLKTKVKKEVKSFKDDVKKGSGKAPSAWVQHLKNYAAEHGVSYKQAMKDGKASYKKG